MQKEKLTINSIKSDLRLKITDTFKKLALFSVLFLALLVLIIIVFPSISLAFVFKWLVGIAAEIFLLISIIRYIKNLMLLHGCLKSTDCIVKDRLVNATFKDRYSRKTRDERYRLNFSQYGDYVIPAENYKWSPSLTMSDTGVYNCAKKDDEFYLVLSKPHAGKILLAYNADFFELEV